MLMGTDMMSQETKRIFSQCVAVLICGFIMGCGGGGGGGSSSSGSDTSNQRTTDTGIRIIHAALDAAPLTLTIGDQEIQTAQFAQPTSYQRLSEGAQTLVLTKSTGEVFAQLPVEFEKGTEHSLLVFGQSGRNSLRFQVLTDQIIRPDAGRGFIHFVNGYEGVRAVTFVCAGSGPVIVGQASASGFYELNSGTQLVIVSDSSGAELGRISLDVPDQGESTVVLTGAREYGAAILKVYQDLD